VKLNIVLRSPGLAAPHSSPPCHHDLSSSHQTRASAPLFPRSDRSFAPSWKDGGQQGHLPRLRHLWVLPNQSKTAGTPRLPQGQPNGLSLRYPNPAYGVLHCPRALHSGCREQPGYLLLLTSRSPCAGAKADRPFPLLARSAASRRRWTMKRSVAPPRSGTGTRGPGRAPALNATAKSAQGAYRFQILSPVEKGPRHGHDFIREFDREGISPFGP